MSKYVFHEHELETYVPPGHSGVVNFRLVSKSQVANHFEMVLGQADPGGSAEPHSHEHSYQVYYILQGQGRVKIGEDPPADFGPGSVIVIPPRYHPQRMGIGCRESPRDRHLQSSARVGWFQVGPHNRKIKHAPVPALSTDTNI